MKKMRKGKKILLIALIALVVIIVIALIVGLVKKFEGPDVPEIEYEPVIQLPDTTYSDMEVKNIEMVYLKDNDETMVSMEIHNTTEVKVEKDKLDAILVGPDENVLGKIQTYIKELNVGEQYDISIVLKGDLTATKQIKLIKK